MTLQECIEKQREMNRTPSKTLPPELRAEITPTFYSGRKFVEGDEMFFGMLETATEDQINYDLISFHEDEIGVLYEAHPTRDNASFLAYLVRKTT